MGKGQTAVRAALEELRQALPFPLRGIDSDNGSEFINNHLVRYCADRKIQFTRGRPYKKDDNAHIEQKNYTHVRKLMGWERYDSPHARARMNDLYQHEVRLMMNLYQPSVKLLRKERIGSRLTRRYDAPKTPLDRLAATPGVDAATIRALHQLRAQLDPFWPPRSIRNSASFTRLPIIASVPAMPPCRPRPSHRPFAPPMLLTAGTTTGSSRRRSPNVAAAALW